MTGGNWPGGPVPDDYPHKPDDIHNRCTPGNHRCVHDWRIHWGNVKRTVRGEGGG